MTDQKRWWQCPSCEAINDGNDGSKCWNCGAQRRVDSTVQFTENVCKKCDCAYVAPKGLERCPYHSEEDHYGHHAYYPPMLPALYLLWMNNLDWNGEKIVPLVTT